MRSPELRKTWDGKNCDNGASRGLGRALFEELSGQGHAVVGCSRSEGDRLARVDVASPEHVSEWARQVLEDEGAPDLLLNNAGYFPPRGELWEVEPEHFRDGLEVNVMGTFLVARAFLPAMIRAGTGVVVNFTSGRARNPAAQVAPYCAAKSAVEALTFSLAQELPDGLAAVAFNPGVVHTDMLETSFGSKAHDYHKPHQWVKEAVPLLMGLGPKDNGRLVGLSVDG